MKTPALVHILFKQQDLVEFVLHEAELVERGLAERMRMFCTPLAVMIHFPASGESGLLASFR